MQVFCFVRWRPGAGRVVPLCQQQVEVLFSGLAVIAGCGFAVAAPGRDAEARYPQRQLHRVQLMQLEVGGEWQAAHEAGIAEGQAQAAAPAQHPRQFVQHRGQVRPEVQGVDRQRGIHRGIGDRQCMGVAVSHRRTFGHPGVGQPLVAGLDHGRGQLDAQIVAAGGLQHQWREGRIARADLQDPFAGTDGQQPDCGQVECAVAVVHRVGHRQRGLAVGLPQLCGQGGSIQHHHRPLQSFGRGGGGSAGDHSADPVAWEVGKPRFRVMRKCPASQSVRSGCPQGVWITRGQLCG
ncbi:hypothetical protein WJ66_02791 [Stenotrophomonas maltophilia WJ66]|nr:hypothetical protein WJ66_02791 [Stenotrophomonas maltophilia WJ66]